MQLGFALVQMALPAMTGVDKVYANAMSGTGWKGQRANQSHLQGANTDFFPSLSPGRICGIFTRFNPPTRISPESVQKSRGNPLLHTHLQRTLTKIAQHDMRHSLIKLSPRQRPLQFTTFSAFLAA
jgi:hypothetical protein